MTHTRRQFAWTIAAGAGAAALLARSAAAQDDLPPNLFISPCGKPFRAPDGAPYPVVDWFKAADKNADGKLDRPEFLADAEAFFHFLDFGKSGVIDNFDVSIYEHRLVPEILGFAASALPPRLWLAQSSPGPAHGGAPVGPASPGGQMPNEPSGPKGLDESSQGASPFSFFDEPEPVTAADRGFKGYITRDDFLGLADRHFTDLDQNNAGFLTLAGLPKTKVQLALERLRPRKRS
jgi:hypothetical protein